MSGRQVFTNFNAMPATKYVCAVAIKYVPLCGRTFESSATTIVHRLAAFMTAVFFNASFGVPGHEFVFLMP